MFWFLHMHSRLGIYSAKNISDIQHDSLNGTARFGVFLCVVGCFLLLFLFKESLSNLMDSIQPLHTNIFSFSFQTLRSLKEISDNLYNSLVSNTYFDSHLSCELSDLETKITK